MGEPYEPEALIITEEDEFELFVQFRGSGLLPPRIADAIYNNHALFLGMSLRDWTQRLLLYAVTTNRRDLTSGWIVSLNVPALDEVRLKYSHMKILDEYMQEFTEQLKIVWSARPS